MTKPHAYATLPEASAALTERLATLPPGTAEKVDLTRAFDTLTECHQAHMALDNFDPKVIAARQAHIRELEIKIADCKSRTAALHQQAEEARARRAEIEEKIAETRAAIAANDRLAKLKAETRAKKTELAETLQNLVRISQLATAKGFNIEQILGRSIAQITAHREQVLAELGPITA
jgi:chromosome segregation ATPase